MMVPPFSLLMPPLAAMGGGDPVLAMGPIGLWYSENYQATPRRALPNTVSSASLSQNLMSVPRRQFNNNDFWSKAGVTVTADGSTAAPDNTNDASILTGTGDSILFGSITLPAGTFTMAITAKRGGGSDQNFTMECAGVAASSTKVATASWQRFSFTFTTGSGTKSLYFARAVASAGYSLQVIDAVLYPGSSDLGEPALGGHVYLGQDHYDARPSYASGVLDMTNSGFGTLQFPADLALTTFTLITVASKTVNTATAFSASISRMASYLNFAPTLDHSRATEAWFGAQQILTDGTTGGLNPYGDGWKVYGVRYDGTKGAAFMNGAKFIEQSVSVSTPASVADLMYAAFQSTSFTGLYKIHAVALFNRALSDTEVATAYTALKARAALSSLSIAEADRFVLMDGDSITSDVNSYSLKYGPNASPKAIVTRRSVAGGTLTGIISRAAFLDALAAAVRPGCTLIHSVFIGANDLTTSSDVAGFTASLAAYCDARRAAGWKVAVCTLLPNHNANFNSRRNTFNATVTGSWLGVHCDAIVDFAADPTMGPDGAENNLTYYLDGVHPTDAGHVILETVYRPVINGMT